jgi:microcystin degradation protein MlrC
MVRNCDVLVAYRTNPHVDMAERGAESADLDARAGGRNARDGRHGEAAVHPALGAQNTKSGPYADIIAYGQSKIDKRVMNVSVVSGFSLGDCAKNGMSVTVTTRNDARLAAELARDIAQKCWDDRKRYIPRLTLLEDATRMALACGADPARPALLFADVADNPGGGGRGNTVWILESFHKAGVQGALLGHRLRSRARSRGEAPRSRRPLPRALQPRRDASRSRASSRPTRRSWRCTRAHRRQARHLGGPHDQPRTDGAAAGGRHPRGRREHPPAVQGHRDVRMLRHRHRQARSVIVKSRGHFRAAFDIFFPDERIIEVDVPGLTTPILTRVPYRNVPRPIYPLDPEMSWQA